MMTTSGDCAPVQLKNFEENSGDNYQKQADTQYWKKTEYPYTAQENTETKIKDHTGTQSSSIGNQKINLTNTLLTEEIKYITQKRSILSGLKDWLKSVL